MLKLSMTAAIAVTLSAPVAIALPADHTSKSSGSAFQHVQYRDGHRDHRYDPRQDEVPPTLRAVMRTLAEETGHWHTTSR